ncbi:hypothetical protein O0I10_005898 [Lichtheimia ornata]|uniref:Uncharacterized protein n=1 Tax=Lichtheimia ornata TaxID=688661 RepID=A0AAD7V5B7_9FUNG|nr:uncharacterized protein O0I10_005898 [Lichtheimia ornata]KAJ8658545.1 hypothetical protein O0I10_005898 [Lichtheimia ornata]
MNENNYEPGLYESDVLPCHGSNWPCVIRAVLSQEQGIARRCSYGGDLVCEFLLICFLPWRGSPIETTITMITTFTTMTITMITTFTTMTMMTTTRFKRKPARSHSLQLVYFWMLV